MKFLVAFALLVLAVAEAHHTPQHTLRGPRFQTGKVYRYDVRFSVTSGVLGLSSQVSRAALKASVSIYAKNAKEHFLNIENVYTSGSVKAVDSKTGDIRMEKNSELEDRLSVPIMFTLENGEVTKYSLSPKDNLESQKIKKSILRSLEMHLPETAIQQIDSNSELKIPVVYNETESTEFGVHTTHYLITVSPYPEFPENRDVYNITRSDDFEAERYPAHTLHSNFRKQGCSEVCRKDWERNDYGAGCPVGHEPHHGPIKTSFDHQHHLSLKDEIMNPEIIRTTETHVAQLYDQDMEVRIRYDLRRINVSPGSIVEPSGQRTFTDLKDMKAEINEEEINKLCNYKTSKEAKTSAQTLLAEITRIVVNGDLEDMESALLGENVVLLRDALSRLSATELEAIAKDYILPKDEIKQANEVEMKVMRQIWMEMLPLVGTEQSVTFLVNYIKKLDENLLIWEAKEMLEALPQNIQRPTERNVRELRSLITDNDLVRKMRKNPMLLSAVHLTLGRVVGEMCGSIVVVRSEPVQQSSWFGNYRQSLRSLEDVSSSLSKPSECPESLIKEIVKDVTDNLERTEKPEELAIYLESLAHIGIPEVLPVIARYAYGVADNVQRFGPKHVDFIKTVALYALHNVAGKHPDEVLQIVLPIFFNYTEVSRVRNAAFGVLIRCQPSREILEHVATKSWSESSTEVASYVTSTLETFGNASLPCLQLTSHRIKNVLPRVKRSDIGMQHAKNFLWSYFDDLREFGLEKRFEYIPSNESFVPSLVYKSLSYSMDSLRDVLIQLSLNIEGLTQQMIFQYIDQSILGIKSPKYIPNSILRQTKLVNRVPDMLRFTLYRRLFYKSSYNYFDLDNFRAQSQPLFDYINTFMKPNSYDYNGQLVKVFLPSSYRTVTIAKTLPYPVEFEMRQPLVLAIKIESLKRASKLHDFNFRVKPSIYHTKLYTNQLKNIGDCKEVGVYHVLKLAASLPFEIKSKISGLIQLTASYKLPELRKKVFTYFSESGTYAGRKTLENLPFCRERKPIRVLPSLFKHEKEVNIVGVPPLRVQLNTEDISFRKERLPRSAREVVDYVIKKTMNAGWRHKSINITLVEDNTVWPRDTEVTFKIKYDRTHFKKVNLQMSQPQSSQRHMEQPEESQWNSEWASESQWDSQSQDQAQSQWYQDSERQSEEHTDWIKDLNPNDISDNKDPQVFIDQAKLAGFKINSLPHIRHALKFEVETRPVFSSAYFKVEYNHTYSKFLHAVHIEGSVNEKHGIQPHVLTLNHIMAFFNKENEFKYHAKGEDQFAVFFTTLRSDRENPTYQWDKIHIITKGVFDYESLESLLKNELLGGVDGKHFLPESHEKCLKDVEDGRVQSVDCVKAIREHWIYNKMKMCILWEKNLPYILEKASRRADLYLKHYLFTHMNVTDKRNTEDRVFVVMNFIDKFTDKPVFDAHIEKPSETLQLRRVPTGGVQPLSSIYGIFESGSMEATNNTYPPTCVMMENYVRTYDLKSYRYRLDKCNYVLSTHCTQNKYFAITARGLDNSKSTKEVTMYLGKNTLILTPKSGSIYKIQFNSKEYLVGLEPMVFQEKDAEIYVFVDGNLLDRLIDEDRLHVIARKAGVSVLYDGVNVKVQVDPRYKGELCGLCSEFDGEGLREYRGLDRCLYTSHIDFARSAIINREGSCDKSRLVGKRMCEGNEASMHFSHDTKDDEYEPTEMRNIVETKGSEYCFSILPVPVCKDEAQPSETESHKVAFHCLPKKDITTMTLLSESKRRVLEEIENKSADFEETLEIAKIC